VGLAQLIKFIVVELPHPGSNPRFDDLTWVLHLRLIILLVRCDVPIDNKTFLMTNFINLKIKPTQSFRCAHMGRVCMRVFIRMSDRVSAFVLYF
jgi:hypothetical protein